MIRFQSNVKQHLGEWGAFRLKIPGLVEDCMVRCFGFDDSRVYIDVADVLVSCGVPKKNVRECVTIQLGSALAWSFNTNGRSKNTQQPQVWLEPMPSFEWGHHC
jgi:hypothetical protein